MNVQYPAMQQQVLYQAEPSSVQTLKSIQDRTHHICKTYINRRVRIQTLSGHVHEGVIVGCDDRLLYLRISKPGIHRAFYGPSDEAILTLVLFELLVIVLLS
ncbi:hypothetical protein [Paenibacillus rhizophilus]|uniref:Uncharacterized protein n=1 Tax=Paenibacillus rhizophilus TaxID=1850366 RepID=A0A3N9P5L1_9BACL|nr:hypothetical protein [Paenibacillus rhizophilus]RQW10607.1 hypothetical protein EH198_15230 [Paenibacillus rhizophilus]